MIEVEEDIGLAARIQQMKDCPEARENTERVHRILLHMQIRDTLNSIMDSVDIRRSQTS